MAVELKKGIYWVGAIDWNLRDFHGYVTGRGATYNSYLIIDEKVTLIDTVKAPFYQEMLDRIKEIIDPSKIDLLISNHLEPDHSGSIPQFVRDYPQAKIYTGKMAEKGFKKYFPGIAFETVKTGDSLKLGKRTIQFIETPMIHWPDSIFSYIPEEELLFSMDGFGQHIATSGRFDDEVDMHNVMSEAGKYYANLLTHLSPLISTTLKKVAELNLAISMIAPSHGIIWRSHIPAIMEAYQRWSSGQTKKKIIIVYDTMWTSTEKLACQLADTTARHGIETKLMKLRDNHRSDVMAELLDASGLLLGSPTIHRNLFPTVADILCYMRGLKPGKKFAAAFGSYGWSGESVDLINSGLKEAGFDVIEPGVKALFAPDADEMAAVRKLAETMIERIDSR
jgi:flavorubredoxin